MDPAPLVSVILPTFNRQALLREAIDSVFAQTYEHWELIVVDDGSTDGTHAYLASLDHPRVHVILAEHSGNAAKVRNVGIAAARGMYVAFQDSDDLWTPDKLARQIEQLLAHPECGWSYTDANYIDEHGHEYPIPGRRPWVPHNGWILEDLIELRVGIPLPSVVVEKRILDLTGGFDERLPRRHDFDLWLRIAEVSQAIAVPARLMSARKHAGNVVGLRIQEQQYMDLTFAELAARSRSPRIRRAARRRRVLMSLHFVDQFRWAERYAEARRLLWRSFSFGWWYPRWWIALIKTYGRPALPRGVRSMLLARAERRRAS